MSLYQLTVCSVAALFATVDLLPAAANALSEDEVVLLQYTATTKRSRSPEAAISADTPHSNRYSFSGDSRFVPVRDFGGSHCLAGRAAESLADDEPVVKVSGAAACASTRSAEVSTLPISSLEQAAFLGLFVCLTRFLWVSKRRCAEATRIKGAARASSARAVRFAASAPVDEPSARPLVVLPPAAPRSADPDAALLRAAECGDAAGIAAALRCGARLGAEDAWGCTALHFAARLGSAVAVELLLARGASVDALEAWDETPLHLAAVAGHSGVCELLLGAGAAVNAANGSDQTPLFAATRAGHGKTAGLLRALGGVGAYETRPTPLSFEGVGDAPE